MAFNAESAQYKQTSDFSLVLKCYTFCLCFLKRSRQLRYSQIQMIIIIEFITSSV